MFSGLYDVRIGRGGPLCDFPTYAKWALLKIGIDAKNVRNIEVSVICCYNIFIIVVNLLRNVFLSFFFF